MCGACKGDLWQIVFSYSFAGLSLSASLVLLAELMLHLGAAATQELAGTGMSHTGKQASSVFWHGSSLPRFLLL